MVVFVDILFFIVLGAITLFMGALFLMLATKIFITKNSNYKTAFKITTWPVAIVAIVSIILGFTNNRIFSNTLWILTFIAILVLSVYLVKERYSVKTGKSILLLFVAFFLGIIPYAIVILILSFLVLLFTGFPFENLINSTI